jgi:hypothetical protein
MSWARIAAAVGVLALTAAAVGYSIVDLIPDTCLEREADGYPQLEDSARTALDGVDFSLHRAGACEDTGKPWTRGEATVYEWPTRTIANRHFRALGWTVGGRGLTSPDGLYRASNSITTDVTGQYVTVAFEEVADETEFTGG